jgi:hypothetical protein
MDKKQANALASLFLKQFSNCKRTLVSLAVSEFNMLKQLTHAQPDRVIRGKDGRITLYQYNTKRIIHILKEQYDFLTPKEVEKQVQEAAKDHFKSLD